MRAGVIQSAWCYPQRFQELPHKPWRAVQTDLDEYVERHTGTYAEMKDAVLH